MSFLEKFDKEFAPKLAIRAKTFRKVFEELEKKNKDFYLIIETGCARTVDGFVGDGMSTVLFDAFVNFYDGLVVSVDINKEHCMIAKDITSNKTTIYHSDSVEFLSNYRPIDVIDLLYLDSFDINFNAPKPSAEHHMNEFNAILPKLDFGTLVVVDDHKSDKAGKGMYIAKYMKNLGYERFIDDYQIGWIL